MLDFSLEELVFVVTALAGGVALLRTSLGNGLTRRRATGRPGLAPMASPVPAFVALFGVGGLVASRVLDVHGVQAVLAASGAGLIGLGLAVALRTSERPAKD